MNSIASAATDTSVRSDSPAPKTQATDKTQPAESFTDYLTGGIPDMLLVLLPFLPQETARDAGPVTEADAGGGTAVSQIPALQAPAEGFGPPEGTGTIQKTAAKDADDRVEPGDQTQQDIKVEQPFCSLAKREVSGNSIDGIEGADGSGIADGTDSTDSQNGPEILNVLKDRDDSNRSSDANGTDNSTRSNDSNDSNGANGSNGSQCPDNSDTDRPDASNNLNVLLTRHEGDNLSMRHGSAMGPQSPAAISSAQEVVAGDRTDGQKKDRHVQSPENGGKSENMFSAFDKTTGPEIWKVAHRKAETHDVSVVFRDTLVVAKKDHTSLEVSIEPDGMGKLDIHLNSDRGVVHARIDASDSAGRELIDRHLDSIINTLAGEGINIGSFYVNLRNGQGHEESEDAKSGPRYFRNTSEQISLPVSGTGDGLINIFV
jgi:uncharacterized protein (DUF2249 family)